MGICEEALFSANDMVSVAGDMGMCQHLICERLRVHGGTCGGVMCQGLGPCYMGEDVDEGERSEELRLQSELHELSPPEGAEREDLFEKLLWAGNREKSQW